MPSTISPPLSSTVISVFDQFLKKLEDEKVLTTCAQEALAQSLHEQKLDHESLRRALFKPDESPK
jgi:hypothetical protein